MMIATELGLYNPLLRCGWCDNPAEWRWVPKNPPPAYHQFMCDDHAASHDLSELEELCTARGTGWPR